MAVTDEVLQILAASRGAINELTDQQVVSLATAWVTRWDQLLPELEAAVTDLLASAEDGTVTYRQAQNAERLQRFLVLAEEQARALQAEAEAGMIEDIRPAVEFGSEAAENLVRGQLPTTGTATVPWVRMNDTAVQALIARTTQQIHASSLPLADDMVAAMKRELVKSIAVGDNPRTTGRRIMQRTEGHFNGGLARATRIARTELLDAYRTASLETEKQNRDIITGWVWYATLDARVCTSCLAMHGTFHDVDEFGPADHQNGRCARLPKTKSWADLGFTGIEDDEPDYQAQRDAWFENLTDDTQRAVMGKARLELFKSGAIGWDDMTTRKENPNWRPAYYETPVKDLTAA
jgi:SPP1 gp7 family putative phage head morphogenesis protein